MTGTLGPLVRLAGISTSQLPSGGNAPGKSATSNDISSAGTDLKTFVTNVLNEAIPFIDGVAPKSGASPTWKSKGTKHYSSSEAPVPLYERVVSGKELDSIADMDQLSADRKDETWFCRRSCHRDSAEKGTASWTEFVEAFRDKHPETEDAFTPTVIGARTAMIWDVGSLGSVLAQGGQGEGEWKVESLKVVEMTHKIDPKPLKNRTFPVVQLSASLIANDEFMVVSIPLTDFETSEFSEAAKDKSLVVAAYVSVERIRILPQASLGGKEGEIEWIMATASDARGVLPQWVQNLAVPSQVAHDVDMFLKWLFNQRSRASLS